MNAQDTSVSAQDGASPELRPGGSAQQIESWLVQRIATLMQRSAQEIDVKVPLTRYGLDSVEAVTLSGDLEDLLERRLASTLVWDYPTISQLAQHLGQAAAQGSANVMTNRVRVEPQVTGAAPSFADDDDVKNNSRRLRLLDVPGVGNPYFRRCEGINGDRAVIGQREVVNFASYNYLGLSGHPDVSAAAKDAIDRYGTSDSASRLISGERPVHVELEAALAKLVGAEDALVYVGGHATNVTTLGHMFGSQDLIVYDELIHDSVLGGAELSGATRLPFRHQDLAGLDALLTRRRADHANVLIVVEGVYSADGDVPDLAALVALKKRHRAFLMVDEAHSLGVLGKTGRGVGEHFGVDGRDVDMWMGTLSKSLASCGGYIAGSRKLVEYLRYTSPGFIYSVGMPPSNAAAALAALQVMEREPERVTRLHERVKLFLSLAREYGLDTGTSAGSAVVPVIVGDTLQAIRLSGILMDQGINVAPMIYPAVANDGARLRFFISSLHTEEQIRHTLATVSRELARLKRDFSGSFEVMTLKASPDEHPNMTLAREGFDGFVTLDLPALSRQLAPDVVYHFPGRSPLAGAHKGKDAVLDFFVNAFRYTVGTLNVRLKELLADANHAVLYWSNTAHLPGTDLRLSADICEVLTLKDGKVVEAHWFVDNQRAFDEFVTQGARYIEAHEASVGGTR